MGYMGFGMRKIDYTRRPRKFFGAYKEIYGEHIEQVGHPKKEATLSANSSWVRHSYKPFDEWKGYVFIRRILYFGPLLLLSYMILKNAFM